jgi:HK97 family phage major capsid protein
MNELEKALAMEVPELSDEQKALIKSNVEKISDEQKTKFAEVIGEEKEEGVDVEAVKSLVSKSVAEALAKKVDQISDEIVSKFTKGAAEARKKAIDTGKVEEDKGRNETKEFMKALLGGDKARCKVLSGQPSGANPDDGAGLLIPTELRNEVLRVAEAQYGLARQEMFYLPFSGPGNSRTIPALGTSVSVFWTDEGGKKKSTQPKFSVVVQTLKKLAAIVPFTEEILEDSAINLTSLVATLFAEAVSKEEDLQFFAGTGSPWTGILNNGQVNIVQQATGDVNQVTVDDLIDMEDATPAGALNGSKYYFHRSILSVLRKMKDQNGQYVLVPAANGQPATLNGYPYKTSEAFPAKADVGTGDPYIMFANLKQAAVFGDKQQLRVKLLDQATITDTDDSTVLNLAEQDMVALRIVERVGYVVALPKAATVLKAQAHES